MRLIFCTIAAIHSSANLLRAWMEWVSNSSSFLSGCQLQASSILNPAAQSEPFPISVLSHLIPSDCVNEKSWCDPVAVFFTVFLFQTLLYALHFHRPLITKASCCAISMYLSVAYRQMSAWWQDSADFNGCQRTISQPHPKRCL